jgi:outer membrane translocation and assembly module TamA
MAVRHGTKQLTTKDTKYHEGLYWRLSAIMLLIREVSLLKRLLICACLFASLPLNGQADSRAQRTTAIRNILFRNAAVLSVQERRELAKKIRQDGREFGVEQWPENASQVADVAEEHVREAFQDKGYFKVKVSATAEPVAGSPSTRQFNIVATILDSGQQFRLREIGFINAKAFSEAELLKLIPVQRGEIFSRAKIQKGLEALHQQYDSAGYVNITFIPNTEFDDANAGIRLNIDVDEGNLFRWGELHITGLDSGKRQELTDGWEALRGKPYSPASLQGFCSRFFRPTPVGTDPTQYTKRKIDERTGTIDVSIAFATPPWVSD